jgi:GT2 family glycosyltransferase
MHNSLDKIIPIIILNWNGEDDTIECLESINTSDKSNFVPVIVDNGSESLLTLKNKCRSIYKNILFFNKSDILNFQLKPITDIFSSLTKDTLVFIENGENLGFAKGNNIGIKFAEIICAEWVMLLNNDTVISKDTFVVLDNFIKNNPTIKAVTPQIRLFEPSTKIWNCGGDLTYFGSRKYNLSEADISKVPINKFSKITFITGCALLFNYKVTGPLTEKFFFGEEDYEFSLRMKKNKFKMACVYDAVIYHKVGASIKKSSSLLAQIYINYCCRLINTRNYYSLLRWKITKILAFLYLPLLLLLKFKINPLKAISLIRHIDKYIKHNDNFSFSDFQNSNNLNYL